MEQIVDSIMIGIILFLLFGWTYKLVGEKMSVSSSIKIRHGNSLLIISVGMIYFSCFIYIMAMMYILDNAGLIIYFLLLLIFMISSIGMTIFLITNKKQLNKKMLIIFCVVLLVIMYITIISRHGTVETGIQMYIFHGVRKALQTGNYEEINHFGLNTILFIPLGYFFAGIKPENTAKIDKIIFLGISLSTFIESVQMIFRWGNCDIDDIIANSIGTILGYLLYKIAIRMEFNKI